MMSLMVKEVDLNRVDVPEDYEVLDRGLQLTTYDIPGFWESLGYHDYGDPWREQRYQGD
jgi:DMSO/TMAO reductase YedYZ molybdopterin-dependent catalytic subunit